MGFAIGPSCFEFGFFVGADGETVLSNVSIAAEEEIGGGRACLIFLDWF